MKCTLNSNYASHDAISILNQTSTINWLEEYFTIQNKEFLTGILNLA